MTAPRPDIQRSCAAFDTSIGITERVSAPATFWQGIMRHRRTDFLVNEIQKDGTVLHLRNCNIETPRDNNNSNNNGGSNGRPAPPPENEAPEKPGIPAEDVAALEALTSKDFTEKIIDLYKSANPQSKNSVTTDLIEDKATRSKIHQLEQEVRRIFKSEIDTTTDGTGAIVASKRKSNRTKNKNVKFKQRVDCPGTGDFLHFTLFKENRDTMEAANLISRMLSLKSRSIHFAGTKDRRAATVQRCSVRQRTAADLARLNPKLYGMKTGDYVYSHDPIRLGQLKGNEFTIVVKDCHFFQDQDKTVSERVETIKSSLQGSLDSMHKNGWINYFGHQRFGSFATGTNKIGMMIFAGQLEEAVNALLQYDPAILNDPPAPDLPRSNPKHDEYNRALACHIFQTEHNATKALKHLPRRFTAETTIINHLGRSPTTRGDYAGALLHLPRGLRTLYLHAYQSYVWNHAASKRWALYGDKVVEGDLVIEDKPTAEEADVDEEAVDPEDDDEVAVSARPLTAEEAASGTFTIFDVVLPSAGTSTLLPQNEVGEFYREFMGRPENGGLDPLNLPKRHKEFTAPGRYRHLISRFLAEPSVEVRAYVDDNEQMHPTDLDILMTEKREQGGREKEQRGKRNLDGEGDGASGENPAKKVKLADEAPADVEMAGAVGETLVADKVAAILHFQLGRSAYATVAIREMGLSPDEHGAAGQS
ncbi:hypothetical protein jhhlp_001945 [Lomentospora prolificans]|uniref:TRUD domain-containing protein n=1 Tax=Lomentospora prolificans TaxID=41688 RepID=A0A2N3NCM2_9PEZI|nr:hypothetical protein jhhlp_001945 [Lomentospora prolificans]